MTKICGASQLVASQASLPMTTALKPTQYSLSSIMNIGTLELCTERQAASRVWLGRVARSREATGSFREIKGPSPWRVEAARAWPTLPPPYISPRLREEKSEKRSERQQEKSQKRSVRQKTLLSPLPPSSFSSPVVVSVGRKESKGTRRSSTHPTTYTTPESSARAWV